MKKLANEPVLDVAYVVGGQVRIGHVHLKVAHLERALEFYGGILGFEIRQRIGDSAAFLSAGGYHHHIALNTWESLGGSPPAPGTTGLYHTAVVYPTRTELAKALKRVLSAGISLQGAADHGVSESIYLSDPDENGVELYCDTPKEKWPRSATNGWKCIRGVSICVNSSGKRKRKSKLTSGPKDL